MTIGIRPGAVRDVGQSVPLSLPHGDKSNRFLTLITGWTTDIVATLLPLAGITARTEVQVIETSDILTGEARLGGNQRRELGPKKDNSRWTRHEEPAHVLEAGISPTAMVSLFCFRFSPLPTLVMRNLLMRLTVFLHPLKLC